MSPRVTFLLAGIPFLLACILCLPSSAHADPEVPAPPPAPLPAPGRSALDLLIDKSKVDLKEHRLEVKMNHVASKVTVKVYDESNAVIADEAHDFAGRPPGTPLVVTWSPSTDAAVGRIEVFAYDDDGA